MIVARDETQDADILAPGTLHKERRYTFRFDRTGIGREELAFKFRFGTPHHAENNQQRQFRHIELYGQKSVRPKRIQGKSFLKVSPEKFTSRPVSVRSLELFQSYGHQMLLHLSSS
ncbi:MAG: hypothetical protein QOJ51_361 [Acidobacteriaceae bacterium]|nr:hypothetical protein [Acidobacteriaceae bacterium]